jgi:hypothetical protein
LAAPGLQASAPESMKKRQARVGGIYRFSRAKRRPRPDKCDARQRIEDPSDGPRLMNASARAMGNRVNGQPSQRQRAIDEAQCEKLRNGCLAPSKLRQQARKENGHLRVAEIADEPLPERGRVPPRPEGCGWVCQRRFASANGRDECLDAEESEITGSYHLQGANIVLARVAHSAPAAPRGNVAQIRIRSNSYSSCSVTSLT